MKILIFGGTTEGRELADSLLDLGYEVTVSVATELGKQELEHIPDLQVMVGRKTMDEMAAMLWTGGFKYCIDATHPYAVEVSKNIKEACKRVNLPYERLVRDAEKIELPENTVTVQSAEAACRYLQEHLQDGKVLITTGAKEAKDFMTLPMEQCYIRVLPTQESLELCQAAGFAEDHILTGHGPFSQDANVEAIRQTGATMLVTKDGGATGGFPEKVSAAAGAGATLIVIQRPKETGKTMKQLLRQYERIMEMMQ